MDINKRIPDDKIKSGKQFSEFAYQLTDSEVTMAMEIIIQVQEKYKNMRNSAENLEALRDEALTRLAGIGILANVDPTPALYGEPPVLDIVGKIGDPGFTKETDHERKRYEILKAKERNEDYWGQKEEVNPISKAAKRKKK